MSAGVWTSNCSLCHSRHQCPGKVMSWDVYKYTILSSPQAFSNLYKRSVTSSNCLKNVCFYIPGGFVHPQCFNYTILTNTSHTFRYVQFTPDHIYISIFAHTVKIDNDKKICCEYKYIFICCQRKFRLRNFWYTNDIAESSNSIESRNRNRQVIRIVK